MRTEDSEGSGSSPSCKLPCGPYRILYPELVDQRAVDWRGVVVVGGDSWLCCPDSDEHTTLGRGEIAVRGWSFSAKMRAAGRQVTVTAEKLNGDVKRRPSYPGELRAKHTNMSTKIWVKVAMAIAYFLCVSVAALILVIYYVFFWTPDPQYNITSTEAPSARRG